MKTSQPFPFFVLSMIIHSLLIFGSFIYFSEYHKVRTIDKVGTANKEKINSTGAGDALSKEKNLNQMSSVDLIETSKPKDELPLENEDNNKNKEPHLGKTNITKNEEISNNDKSSPNSNKILTKTKQKLPEKKVFSSTKHVTPPLIPSAEKTVMKTELKPTMKTAVKATDKTAASTAKEAVIENSPENSSENAKVPPTMGSKSPNSPTKETTGLYAPAESGLNAPAESGSHSATPAEALAGVGAGSNQEPGSNVGASDYNNSTVVVTNSEIRPLDGNIIPEYEDVDRMEQRHGEARFLVFVGRDGIPQDFKMSKSSGHRSLDFKTLKAIRQWKFEAGQEGWVELPFLWDLKKGVHQQESMKSPLRTRLSKVSQ